MLLAIDVGNSTTVLGVFEGDVLAEHWRVSTSAQRTQDEYALVLDGLLGFAGLSIADDVEGVVVSSVVPPVTETLRAMVQRYGRAPAVVVEPGTRTGIELRYDNPHEIGPDRIVNAVAAGALYGRPSVVVDFGTSTNFDVVGPSGAFLGGAIAPGVATSVDALTQRAARLPKIETGLPPTAIGRTTVGAMQSGVVFGFAGQVDAVVQRIQGELDGDAVVVATGGLAPAILDACTTIDHHDMWLTLKGLRLVWERNQR